jgi:hypothetical protein
VQRHHERCHPCRVPRSKRFELIPQKTCMLWCDQPLQPTRNGPKRSSRVNQCEQGDALLTSTLLVVPLPLAMPPVVICLCIVSLILAWVWVMTPLQTVLGRVILGVVCSSGEVNIPGGKSSRLYCLCAFYGWFCGL